MANYASLRGPVGMNRVFLETGGDTSEAAVNAALRAGRTFASNGPLLGLEIEGQHPGGTVSRAAPGNVGYRIALRSPVAVDHLELVQNGKVVKAFALTGDRRNFDAAGEIPVESDGWVVLRAWNDGADPLVLDLYPYATTSPVYLDLPGGLPSDPEDAAYFSQWLDRTIASAEARTDYRTPDEKQAILDYLRSAREEFRKKEDGGRTRART
jgi:hypothetical protein